MSDKKQTAVEWLWGEIKPRCDFDNVPDSILEQAKELEKQQIERAHTCAYLIGEDTISIEDANIQSNKYYNETYGGNNG